jgi:hypothetical protein
MGLKAGKRGKAAMEQVAEIFASAEQGIVDNRVREKPERKDGWLRARWCSPHGNRSGRVWKRWKRSELSEPRADGDIFRG